ncbi:unnamed protein product, partial [Haemonchus placei]|uniref:Secreted protein n=1 Tax=Haemonchus placei TaxID=6290 RepID=A0A0N4WDI9_HAEPC
FLFLIAFTLLLFATCGWGCSSGSCTTFWFLLSTTLYQYHQTYKQHLSHGDELKTQKCTIFLNANNLTGNTSWVWVCARSLQTYWPNARYAAKGQNRRELSDDLERHPIVLVLVCSSS